MRLVDLNPRWCSEYGLSAKQGVTFDCPHCRTTRLGVWFDVPVSDHPPIDIARFKETLDCDHPEYQHDLHETHLSGTHWHRDGDSFENLTLSPSIDASKFGHWHGYVTMGEIL